MKHFIKGFNKGWVICVKLTHGCGYSKNHAKRDLVNKFIKLLSGLGRIARTSRV